MRAQDAPDEWTAQAEEARVRRRNELYARGLPPSGSLEDARMAAALAAVIPLIEAREREVCARMLDNLVQELQNNIDDNISEVRVVDIGPEHNRPLIKARDWLRCAAAIRARTSPEPGAEA